MTLANSIQNIRNVLYRVKAKVLYTSGLSMAIKNLMWRPMVEGKKFVAIYRKKDRSFDLADTTKIGDSFVKERFEWENRKWSEQENLIFRYDGEIIIEPTHGLAFNMRREFMTQTRGHAHNYLYPSLLAYLRLKMFNTKKTHYKEVIHFDGFVSKNLYHFFDDALNPLLLMLNSGVVPADTPILLGESIYRLKYVQYFLKEVEPFNRLNCVIQRNNEWVCADRLYKADASSNWWRAMYTLLHNALLKSPHRKIFINRRNKHQRRLVNVQSVERILMEYGFETIYAEDLSYEEQIKIFNDAEHIVAIHGAGLTNILYSDVKRLHVLELFSKSYLGPHYYWLGAVTGIRYYDAIAGGEYDINYCFTIDTSVLKQAVDKMLNA